LHATSKAKNLDFKAREKLVLKLKKLMKSTQVPLQYSFFIKALQTEIELRHFDEDYVEFLAEYFCNMPLDHHNHRRSKENICHKVTIFWLFSQTSLPYHH